MPYDSQPCILCGVACTTHPDASNPLAYCGDCGGVTCPDHRVEDAADRCNRCAAIFYGEPAPTVGTAFKIRHENYWSGPCANCHRRVARKRAYKGEQPCTNHHKVDGMEVAWHAAVVSDDGASWGSLNVHYRTTARLSIENPLPGTAGATVDRGGMTVAAWHEGLRDGTIILL